MTFSPGCYMNYGRVVKLQTFTEIILQWRARCKHSLFSCLINKVSMRILCLTSEDVSEMSLPLKLFLKAISFLTNGMRMVEILTGEMFYTAWTVIHKSGKWWVREGYGIVTKQSNVQYSHHYFHLQNWIYATKGHWPSDVYNELSSFKSWQLLITKLPQELPCAYNLVEKREREPRDLLKFTKLSERFYSGGY